MKIICLIRGHRYEFMGYIGYDTVLKCSNCGKLSGLPKPKNEPAGA